MGGKSRFTGIRSPDCPARSQLLYRLSYPAHINRNSKKQKKGGKLGFIQLYSRIRLDRLSGVVVECLFTVSKVLGSVSEVPLSLHGHLKTGAEPTSETALVFDIPQDK